MPIDSPWTVALIVVIVIVVIASLVATARAGWRYVTEPAGRVGIADIRRGRVQHEQARIDKMIVKRHFE